MIKKITIGVLLVSALTLSVGGIAGAQESIPGEFTGINTTIKTGSGLVTAIQGIVDWIFVALLIAAGIFIVLAGFQFVTQGGDPNAIGEARRKLLYAAIGIIIATLAKAIPLAIRNITGT